LFVIIDVWEAYRPILSLKMLLVEVDHAVFTGVVVVLPTGYWYRSLALLWQIHDSWISILTGRERAFRLDAATVPKMGRR
jgi:hypothetical protein